MKSMATFWQKNKNQLMAVFGAFMVVGLVFQISIYDFQANLLAGKKSAAFDGTTSPIKKSPNWVALTSTEWKAGYNEIPQDKMIDLPEYIPANLSIPMSNLNLKNDSDKMIRNAQVTFSTPYMGDYKLNGMEYAGSHLAVDIKVPTGTPIYAIANAVVVKAQNQTSGFGYHVVLRHDDVPSAADANVKTTYYSSYSHLGSYLVNEGELVSKGQLIGYSGNSGTATTPHLHFQIDNDQAPWHPYWPYTSKEAADAGYSFWEAVNAGLGKEKALSTTISPMAYVQKYKNFSTNSAGSTNSNPTSNESTNVVVTPPVTTPINNPVENNNTDELPPVNNNNTESEPVVIIAQPPVTVTPVSPVLENFEMKSPESFQTGKEVVFKLIAKDKDGKIINNLKTDAETYLKVENGSATLSTNLLRDSDFVNGIAEFTVIPNADYGLKITAINGAVTISSKVLQASSFSDINAADESYTAINFLKNNDIVRGYPDGTFKPNNPVSRVEALKFIYEGLNKETANRVVLEFSDTDSKAWYARYVAAAKKEGIVKGYDGNLFKPANQVTRAEFLKMVMESSGFNAKQFKPVNKPFSDVDVNSWYSGYVAIAKDKNLLETSSNMFRPNEAMTRGDVSELLYKIILLKVTNGIKFENSLAVSQEDLASFYNKV
jgi:hypothetical protein